MKIQLVKSAFASKAKVFLIHMKLCDVVEEFFEGVRVQADSAYLPRACGDLTDQEQYMVSA